VADHTTVAMRARPGIEPADVLMLMGFLWSIEPGDDGEERTRRVLDLAISGLH
jgi:hypothetical protein